MNFQATGSVQTADGRQIDFQATLELSREYVQVASGQEAQANTTDPLFLNFDGKGVRISSELTAFDLNNDGQTEAIPSAAPGSGLLFLDRIADGVATNGSELFGPQSGNGFADLARQDADGNGWIDESDPVFGQLKIWIQDGVRPGTVYTLAELGVGAISTACANSPFQLKDAGNQLLGQLRASGIYLMEDGRAGLTAQVDLAG